jgi:hypothetical protein
MMVCLLLSPDAAQECLCTFGELWKGALAVDPFRLQKAVAKVGLEKLAAWEAKPRSARPTWDGRVWRLDLGPSSKVWVPALVPGWPSYPGLPKEVQRLEDADTMREFLSDRMDVRRYAVLDHA